MTNPASTTGASVLDELLDLFNETENGAVEAGAISFSDAVEGALPAVLARHERRVRAKVAEEMRTYARNAHDVMVGATYAAWMSAAQKIAEEGR